MSLPVHLGEKINRDHHVSGAALIQQAFRIAFRFDFKRRKLVRRSASYPDQLRAFEGTLSSWWTKIAIGALLLAFILLQRFLQSRAARS